MPVTWGPYAFRWQASGSIKLRCISKAQYAKIRRQLLGAAEAAAVIVTM